MPFQFGPRRGTYINIAEEPAQITRPITDAELACFDSFDLVYKHGPVLVYHPLGFAPAVPQLALGIEIAGITHAVPGLPFATGNFSQACLLFTLPVTVGRRGPINHYLTGDTNR